MLTGEAIQRVYRVRNGDNTGTMFAMDVDGRQYLTTAKHLVENHEGNFQLQIQHDGKWKPIDLALVGHSEEADVSVMAAEFVISGYHNVEATSAGLAFSQEAYFLGFPFGLYGDHPSANGGYPLPFAKAGIVAMFDDPESPIIYLDGHNNPGFSGGPVLFRNHKKNGVWQIAGVVSQADYAEAPIYSGDDDTGLHHKADTGLVIAVPIVFATKLAEANPIGVPVP